MPRGAALHIHPLLRNIKEGNAVIVHMAGGGVLAGIVQPSNDTSILVLALPNGNNPAGRAEIMVQTIGAITHGLTVTSEPRTNELKAVT